MKILLINPTFQEYVVEIFLHGLRTVLGKNVIDIPKYNRIYIKKDKNYKFGLSHTLSDITIDRTEIENKIKDRFFNLVVYGSVYNVLDHFDLVIKYYKPYEIAFIDGEDNPRLGKENIASGFVDIYNKVKEFGVYFKRELKQPTENVYPIALAYPEEQFYAHPVIKTQDYGTTIPGNMETYKFIYEKDYYEDYQKSYFGLTWKKAGWDCFRHYEIIANKCVPYFLGKPDIEDCPPTTMWNFPKNLCKEALQLQGVAVSVIDNIDKPDKKVLLHPIDFGKFNLAAYTDLQERFFEYGLAYLTTAKLAERFLDIMESERRKQCSQ